MNEPELWKETEEMVRKVLIESNIPLCGSTGRSCFLWAQDRCADMECDWPGIYTGYQPGDFSQGRSFKLEYTNQDNQAETP